MIKEFTTYEISSDKKNLTISASKYQQKVLIILPLLFAFVLLVVILFLSQDYTPSVVDISTIFIIGISAYLFTIYLIHRTLWNKISKVPPLFYGISILITTLVGLFVPIIADGLLHLSANNSQFLTIELGFLVYSIIFYIFLSLFIISIRSKTVFNKESGEAIYLDRYLIFPYTLHRQLYFRKNKRGKIQLLIKALKLVSKDMQSMSRTSIVYSFSYEEFLQLEVIESDILVALFDPISNPELKSVLCFKGMKEEVEQFLKLISKYINYEIVKIEDARITTGVYGNAESEMLIT